MSFSRLSFTTNKIYSYFYKTIKVNCLIKYSRVFNDNRRSPGVVFIAEQESYVGIIRVS